MLVELVTAFKLMDVTAQVSTVLLGVTEMLGRLMLLEMLEVAAAVQLLAASVTVKV